MNRALPRILLPVLILASVLAFTLALSPLTLGPSHTLAGAQAQPQQATPTPTPADKSQPGSTDGLVVMSFAIVAIIILPLLIQRALWTR